MSKAKLESSILLSHLGSSIGDVKYSMSENLNILNNAFSVACESLQDKNAQACQNALDKHATAMRALINRLDDFESALNCLSELAADYENI